jgi:hypothetical protein
MISWQAFNPYPPANFSRPQLAPALKFTSAFNACGGGSRFTVWNFAGQFNLPIEVSYWNFWSVEQIEVCDVWNWGRFRHRGVETLYFDGACSVKDKLRHRFTVWNFARQFNLPIEVSYWNFRSVEQIEVYARVWNWGRFLYRGVETLYFEGTCSVKNKLQHRFTVWNFAHQFNLPICWRETYKTNLHMWKKVKMQSPCMAVGYRTLYKSIYVIIIINTGYYHAFT